MSELKTKYQTKLETKQFQLCPDFTEAVLQIETTNICNHQCKFCPNSKQKRKRKFIDKELAYRLINEGSSLGVKSICFHMNGEPLACNYLEDLIAFSKQKGYTYIFITTNGVLADKERLDKLFSAGLDSIKFSINAGTRESYIKIHGKDDFERVLQNLEYAIDYKTKVNNNLKIFISYAVSKETLGEVESFYKRYKDKVDDILYYHLCSYAGQCIEEIEELYVDISSMNVPTFKIMHSLPCAALNTTIAVTCEGYMSICCSEAYNYGIIEDLNKMTIQEAWHGKKMVEMRQKHLEKNVKHTICYNCIYNKKSPIEPLNKNLYIKSLK